MVVLQKSFSLVDSTNLFTGHLGIVLRARVYRPKPIHVLAVRLFLDDGCETGNKKVVSGHESALVTGNDFVSWIAIAAQSEYTLLAFRAVSHSLLQLLLDTYGCGISSALRITFDLSVITCGKRSLSFIVDFILSDAISFDVTTRINESCLKTLTVTEISNCFPLFSCPVFLNEIACNLSL